MDVAHLQPRQFPEPQTAYAGKEKEGSIALLGVRKQAGHVLRRE